MDEFPKLVNSQDNSTIIINNSSFSIGRSLSCDHILESIGVSRFHCIIKKNDEKWTLFDRSTNGTFVNSKLYTFNKSVELRDGDVIKLGTTNVDFLFKNIKDMPKNTTNEETAADSLFPNDEHVFEEAASLLAEGLEQPLEIECVSAEVVTESEPKPETSSNETKTKTNSDSFDIMNDDELTCSICSELFIKAVTLNCSHTYCKFCIEEWRKNKGNCPICRKFISTISPTLVLDNFIEKIINKQNDDVKEARKAIIKQREDVIGVTAGSSTNKNPGTPDGVIEIFSEDDEAESDDSDYNYFSDDHDYDYDCYDNSPRDGPYYGGYGRCFICNQAGHWANTCPFKRR